MMELSIFATKLLIVRNMGKNNVNFTPDFVEKLEEGQVFVFGSNLNGVHSGGASLMALRNFGAEWGQAEGLQGQSYASPLTSAGIAFLNSSKGDQNWIELQERKELYGNSKKNRWPTKYGNIIRQ